MMSGITVILPVYECYSEVREILDAVVNETDGSEGIEVIGLAFDDRGAACLEDVHKDFPNLIAKSYGTFVGLGRAKNDAVRLSKRPFLLFLYPGLRPQPGAVRRLASVLANDTSLAAVVGRWRNAQGIIEKGYNLRRFPTARALAFDALLINKLAPKNRATVHYKMHDFGHDRRTLVEHGNDCVFMLRRSAFDAVGGFSEEYLPGWFDQVEFCLALKRRGYGVAYVPEAEFIANSNPPLINRLVEHYYVEFYKSEYQYARRHFSRIAVAGLRIAVIVGMVQRLVFLYLPFQLRIVLLKHFRSYVSDAYIISLREKYWRVLQVFSATGR